MRTDLARVRSVRTIDGKPSRMPRVSDHAAGLTARGWTVYTEPGPILLALATAGRMLLRLAVGRRRDFVGMVIGRG